MRTNTSIVHLFSRKGECVRHVLDEYTSLTRNWPTAIITLAKIETTG